MAIVDAREVLRNYERLHEMCAALDELLVFMTANNLIGATYGRDLGDFFKRHGVRVPHEPFIYLTILCTDCQPARKKLRENVHALIDAGPHNGEVN